MNFIDAFTLGIIALVLALWSCCACCYCCCRPPTRTVIMTKRLRAAALARMEFDTCAGGDGGGGCAICLADYAAGERRATLAECNHRFHALCIDAWMKYNSTCPLCRHNLV